MILLTGNSLNERHRELNNKVNEAATQGVIFEDVKLQTEKSDVDRLYKIKLADKYRNVEYIIDTLKCGDNLYITKALKCAWLCDEEFSNIINPDYLDTNVFPEMSFKMKRKLLTMISMHVTNYRAECFYAYCMETNLTNNAIKFLLNTTEDFKVHIIKGGNISSISDENMIAVISKSFPVAVAVLETIPKHNVLKYLHNLRFLYSLSSVNYLDLVEKYTLKHELTWEEHLRLGLRISKHIIKNHKDRILCHTLLYINMLNKSILVKYNRPDDVKMFAPLLLPVECNDFWRENFFGQYNFLLGLIPFQERLQYIKHMFTTHYPNEEFELNIQFYHVGLHSLMTEEERESWALKHVENELEHFGSGKDFLWYKFVSFDEAFVAIKKYILIAADSDLRNEIVRVLIHSAKSNRDLQTLFDYYYQRHVNEITRYKENFVDEVLSNHKYFTFDHDCWNAFDKILHSMDVYDNLSYYGHNKGYKIKALVYCIIHGKELHTTLKQYIDNRISMYQLKQETNLLPEGKAEVVYQYLFNVYLGNIYGFDINKFEANKDNEVKNAIRKYIFYLLDLMVEYNKTKTEIPEIVIIYVQLDFEYYRHNPMFREETEPPLSPSILLKYLKSDASLVVSKIPSVGNALIYDPSFRLNKLLRKIRVYFSTDVSIKYLEFFKNILISNSTPENTCNMAVYGIFQLAVNTERIDFVTKYIPTESKIAHDEINRKLLYIRKAVCKCVGISRPVVPLLHVKKYIVGDYLKFCMPLIQAYVANLKPASLEEFVNFLLQSPASVQKHGLRLAFQCFNVKDLKEIISQTWSSTQNVSLRLVMYQAVYNSIKTLNDEGLQTELFEIFNSFTLSLREDDDVEFFKVICISDLPHHILGQHILSAWEALNNLPEKNKLIDYKYNIVNNMASNLNLLPQDVIEAIVSEYIAVMLIMQENKQWNTGNDYYLTDAKWNLVAKYLVYFPDEAAVSHKLKMIQTIIKACVRLWDKIDANTYSIRFFLKIIIDIIIGSISYKDRRSCMHGIRLLEEILNELQEALPLIEVYESVWTLRLNIIAGNIILTIKNDDDAGNDAAKANDKQIFTNCVDKFAKEFTVLLNELIDQGKYYLSALDTMLLYVRIVASTLHNELPHVENKTADDILMKICSKLIEMEKIETFYFAVELLPEYYDFESSLYRGVVHRIKSFDNEEIKYLLYRKLVCDNQYKLYLNAHSPMTMVI